MSPFRRLHFRCMMVAVLTLPFILCGCPLPSPDNDNGSGNTNENMPNGNGSDGNENVNGTNPLCDRDPCAESCDPCGPTCDPCNKPDVCDPCSIKECACRQTECYHCFVDCCDPGNGYCCYGDFPPTEVNVGCFLPSVRWPGPNLRWRLDASTLPQNLNTDQARQAIDDAFSKWANECSLAIEEAGPSATAEIVITFERGDHHDGARFDGPGGILAHTFFRNADTEFAGKVHLCSEEDWVIDPRVASYQLFTVALHEAGHALGLSHLPSDCDPTEDRDCTVMGPSYPQNGLSELTPADRAAIIRLYGSDDLSIPPDPVSHPGEFSACEPRPQPSNIVDDDSDNDGIADRMEIFVLRTNPMNPDTDADGDNDYLEVFFQGTRPNQPIGQADTDDDELSDDEEEELDTNPLNPDSDGDGLPDGSEIYYYGTEPRRPDTDSDGENDGMDPYPNNGAFQSASPCGGMTCPDDGNPCTLNACRNGNCVTVNRDCPNGFQCRLGTCVKTCVNDQDCDDEVVCTVDRCNTAGSVDFCEHTPNDSLCSDDVACTIDECRVVDGMFDCVHAPDNSQCDNDVFCDGSEICTLTGGCIDQPDPCTPTQFCDESINMCVSCLENADCNDNVTCTTDTCAAGVCLHVDACPENQRCDTATSTCVTDECQTDADCDDELFCTGIETCILSTGCQSPGNPCNAGFTCDEENDECLPANVLRLTVGSDSFTGSGGSDVFDGSLSASMETLTIGDMLNGGAGADVLNVQFVNGGTVTPAGITAIETFNLTVLDSFPQTLNAINATGIDTINHLNSADDLTVNNVPALSDLRMTNTSQDFFVSFQPAALTGSGDSTQLTFSGVSDVGPEPDIFIQPSSGANGYETINLISAGASPNSIDQLSQGIGTTLTTINFSGNQGLTIDQELNNSVTTLNGSLATGNLSLPLPTNNSNVTLGSGNDLLRASSDYSTADILNGGAGMDTLELTSFEAAVMILQANVSNFEFLQISNALANTINITNFGANGIRLTAGISGVQSLTVPSGGTVEIRTSPVSNNLAVNPNSDSPSDNFILVLNGVNINGNLTASDFETLNINVAVGPAAITGSVTLANTFANDTINVTGSSFLTLGTVPGNTIDADVLNAGAFTGHLSMAATPQRAISITGGSGNDTLQGGALADVIAGGSGNDLIIGNTGSDALTGGAGRDTFRFDDSASVDIISDWTDGDDLIEISSGNTDFDTGFGLAAAGGGRGSLGVQAVGTMIFLNIAQSTGDVPVATGHFIKLTTPVPAGALDQTTFNSAIGAARVIQLTLNTSMAGAFYDTTNGRMVLFEASSQPSTNIQAGSTIRVIARIPMTVGAYTSFTNADILSSNF